MNMNRTLLVLCASLWLLGCNTIHGWTGHREGGRGDPGIRQPDERTSGRQRVTTAD